MGGLFVGSQMIRAAEVRKFREVSRGRTGQTGVRAEICLGASAEHGSAVMIFQSNSIKVQKAAAALRQALVEEAADTFAAIQDDRIDGGSSG